MVSTVVFYIFVVFTAIQIAYYLTFSSFLFKRKKRKRDSEKPPVSVIVFAKNSAAQLKENLPYLLAQEYPTFEIVLINNASSDETDEVMETFQEENENIKIVNVDNNEAFWNNKKYSLTLGIKASKYDRLLFTDANAHPISEHWISEMSGKFTVKITIILGYEKYKNESTFKNLFFRFHHLLSAIKCFSFAKTGNPFMAFGNNLAYNKAEFFKVNGFIKHIKFKYGEDDLFIRDAANEENINFCISKDSFIETNPPESFSDWFHQQRVSNSMRQHYKFKHRFILSFFILSKVIFYALAVVLFFMYPWELILAFVLAYVLIQYLVIGFSAKKLNEPQVIFFLPFLEISLILIQISIFSANLISKPNHWK
jgi:glycosyltransferase involved in cell wall biosynthesis